MTEQTQQQGSRGAREQGRTNPQSLIPNLPSLLCWLFILTFAIYFSILSVQQHRAFQTNGLDLGNVDQALWNTAQGNFLHFTLMAPIESRLALHVEPILLFFTPFYWLNLGRPEMLLIVQAVVVALGAWPLYQIALYKLSGGVGERESKGANVVSPSFRFLRRSVSKGDPFVPLLVFPLAYLLLPTLESAVLFDFHAVTLAPTFFLFAFWALERKKDAHFLLFLLLAMACKEDMPLVAAMLGLYVGLSRQRWRLAGLTIVLSVVWFMVVFFIIQPHFAASGNIQLDRYTWLGDNPLSMLQTLVAQPGLIANQLWYEADLFSYLTHLFFPTAFLALFSPPTLLPMLPTLAINLLSDNPFTWRLEDFHYGAPLAPFLFISAVYGIAWLTGRLAEWRVGRLSLQRQPSNPPTFQSSNPPFLSALCLLLLTFTLVYHFQRGFSPLSRAFIWPDVTAHHRQLGEILQTVPTNSVILTQSNLAPHLTHRSTIYTDFGYFTNPDFPAPTPADDILLDVTSFENLGGLHQFLQETLLASGNYEVVTAQDGILHLRPSSDDIPTPYTQLPTSFHTFTQPATPPDYDLTVDFGELMRLHGYSLHFNRQEEVQLSLDLEPLQPLAADIQPVIYLLDATGQLIGGTTDLQPGLVWFPPERWVVGETVRIRFDTFPWHTRKTKKYGLALGVVSGEDIWDVSRRVSPTLAAPTELAIRLPANGTVIELARIEQIWNIPQGGPSPRRFTAPGLPHVLAANFDNQIQLLGYSTPRISNLQPFDKTQDRLPILNYQLPITNPQPPTLSITLYWQAFSPPQRLIRFVQLIGPDGLVYGQNDSVPDNGLYPTNLWQPGEVVVETIAISLQPERPPGDYTLHLGLYDPDTGQRLNLVSGEDHVEIEAE